jgi:hypothetical protein
MSNKKITVKRRNGKTSNIEKVVAAIKHMPQMSMAPKKKKPKPKDETGGFAKNLITSAPTAFGATTRISKPFIRGGPTVVKHSEYIGDVSGSTSFTVQYTLPLNPGSQLTFPWLSQIANAYEKFKVRKVQFRYQTESPSSMTGTIALSPEYNVQDPVPVNKAQTLQNMNTVVTVPWQYAVCPIPIKNLKTYNDYYVRIGRPAGDSKTYDPMIMYICTQGQANTNTIGEIWVDYEIELLEPQGNLNPVGGSFISTAQNSTGLWGSLTVPPTNFGKLKMTVNGITNNLVLSPLTVGIEYQLMVVYTGSVVTNLVVSGATGITGLSEWSGVNTAATTSNNVYTFVANATTAVVGYATSTATSFSASYGSCLPIVPQGGF